MTYELIDILISFAIFLITLTMGLSIDLKDFKKIFKHPKKFLIGVVSQIIFLPLITFVIIAPLDFPPAIKVGIMILAACPGGATTNFISYLIKGDVPLSISLTGTNALITLISIPLITNFSLIYFLKDSVLINLPVIETIVLLFITIILPCFIGVSIRKYNRSSAKNAERFLKIISITFLAIVFGIKLFASQNLGGSGITFENVINLLPILLLIHVVSLFIGFFAQKIFKINNNSAITTGIEVGSQNTTLALLIGGTILKNDLMVIPALVYAMFSFFTTLLFGIIMKKTIMKEGIRKETKIYEPL